MAEEKRIIEVQNLRTEFRMKRRTVYAVNGVSYYVNAGEIVGVVGESGCGKSVTQMSSLQLLLSPPAKITDGKVLFEGKKDILSYGSESEEIRTLRGAEIAMIFQEPMTSLNPVLTIGEQIAESVRLHMGMNRKQARERVIELLRLVNIPDPESRYGQYPHEFSGGMCQRIMIAMAMACNPKLLIADEATTALDVTTQAQILETLQEVVKKTNTALIIVTHNLGIVARYADRIYVMYAGRVIESGRAEDIFKNPQHAYTIGLLNSVPRLDDDKTRALIPIDGMPPNLQTESAHCPFLPRCTQALPECQSKGVPEMEERGCGHFAACYNRSLDRSLRISKDTLETKHISEERILDIRDLHMGFPVKGKNYGGRTTLKVLEGVNLYLRKGETLGLVGESGCGKTTVAKCVLRLYAPTGGSILYKGTELTALKEKELRPYRKNIQFIFQDPFGSLDPRQSIGDIVGEPLKVHHLAEGKEAVRRRVKELFEMVGLDYAMSSRAPHELSGGQRQRIGIARALASEPELIICDEPVSALDVSVQAQILNLLESIQRKMNLSYLFIAHDLSVVRHISDRIAVMYLGRIVEIADCDQLYRNPVHPYTKALLSAIPIPDPEVEKSRERIPLLGEMPSVSRRPEGCSFHPRCTCACEACRESIPQLVELKEEPGHFAACPVMYR
ncbi:MAG: ABC transporter ATP-binding protein [Blautia sp.]|nr:ABC transporter ATP-binding protein [Blautia sp.]